MVKDFTDRHAVLQLFPGYTEADIAIFSEFLNQNAEAEPGFIVDFLGSRIRTTSVWKEARALDGQLLGIPVPADFHAEAIEWIGLLKSVRSATNEYVAMELGAGFGPWVIAGGMAARRKGIKNIRLCAVEGDPQHFQFLRQHFVDNGFDPDQHALLEAAVGAASGAAHWPVVENASEQWGCRPIHSSHDYLGRSFENTKRVNIVAMRDLVAREPFWNLIHIDVQGEELEICRSCMDELNGRVRRIVVATHSRKIDGDLLELMCSDGWLLEHEKPAKFSFTPNHKTLEAMVTIDGTQVWRNPGMPHSQDSLTSFSQEITSSIRGFEVWAGAIYMVDITVKNTGTQPWFAGRGPMSVDAGYRWLDSSGDLLPIEGDRAYLGCSVLRPGESDQIKLPVVAPREQGSYTLRISMIQEGVAWFYTQGAQPLNLQVQVL